MWPRLPLSRNQRPLRKSRCSPSPRKPSAKAANAAPAGTPSSPGISRPHTAALALLTINAPGCSGTIPATSAMPAFATDLSSASGTEPSGSQPLRGAPTPAHDSETVDGGIGSSTSSVPERAKRSRTEDRLTVTSACASAARAMVRSPRMVGVASPRRRGLRTHTYAARTRPEACSRMAPSSMLLARVT